MSRVLMRRVWFWKPQWYWFGWKTLIPVYFGHDEYARKTIVFGWTVTGRLLWAYKDCGDAECHDAEWANRVRLAEKVNYRIRRAFS